MCDRPTYSGVSWLGIPLKSQHGPSATVTLRPVSRLHGTGWRSMESKSQRALKGHTPRFIHISSNHPPTTHSAAVSGPDLFLDAGPPYFDGIRGQSAMGLSNPTPFRFYTQHTWLRCIDQPYWWTWWIGECVTPHILRFSQPFFNPIPGYIITMHIVVSHACFSPTRRPTWSYYLPTVYIIVSCI